MMKKAKQRVEHRIGLIVHIIIWIVISVVIMAALDVKTGLMLFAFLGITVIGNFIAYELSSRKITKNYDDVIQREFERMKSEK